MAHEALKKAGFEPEIHDSKPQRPFSPRNQPSSSLNSMPSSIFCHMPSLALCKRLESAS